MAFNKRRAIRAVVGVIVTICTVVWHCRTRVVATTISGVHDFQLEGQKDKPIAGTKPINVWKTLVPLKSTRADVERLFGQPQLLIGFRPLYEFDKENVLFTYARGNCHPNDALWNVPPDTIIEIEVIPQIILSVAELGFDLTKFRREETSHPEFGVYTNLDEGVTVRTKMIVVPEAVVSIRFQGSSRDVGLVCPSKRLKP